MSEEFEAPGDLVTVRVSDGRFVTMPRLDLQLVWALAEQCDALIFWVGGGVNDGWQPLLMPRRLWRCARPLA